MFTKKFYIVAGMVLLTAACAEPTATRQNRGGTAVVVEEQTWNIVGRVAYSGDDTPRLGIATDNGFTALAAADALAEHLGQLVKVTVAAGDDGILQMKGFVVIE